MKVRFIDEYDATLLESDAGPVPRVDDSVLIDEEKYYVRDVEWNINTKEVQVLLSEMKKNDRVVESAPRDEGLSQARVATKRADKALREVQDVKHEISTIRQFLKEKK